MEAHEVRIRESRYAALIQESNETGVSVEEIVDRAITKFLEYEEFVRRLVEERANRARTG